MARTDSLKCDDEDQPQQDRKMIMAAMLSVPRRAKAVAVGLELRVAHPCRGLGDRMGMFT
jgi:hypothetical protein